MTLHREAQVTYERAAALHESAAEFWERHGNPEKAEAEREKAELNRSHAGHEWMRLRVRTGPGVPPP